MTSNWRKSWSWIGLAALLLGLLPMVTSAAPTQPDWSKVEPTLMAALDAQGEAGFYVILTVQADLSGAAALKTKVEKTTYVFEHLKAVADQTQGPLLDYLRAQGVEGKSYYIENMIKVQRASRAVVEALVARPDVAQIMPLPAAQHDPVIQETPEQSPLAIEWNITRVKAPQVWALGYHGEGMVVGDNDTGLQYNHPALVGKYRGNLGGGNFDHNYNWWNGLGSNVPSDSDGHGTHTAGTMVGDDGAGNQIGVAPGAKLIACGALFNSDPVECFEWFLAPWNLLGQNPDPSKAPDAVNNSWYDNSGYNYRPIIQSLNAAGIAVIKSAGNWGSACNTISPPGNVPEIISTAAFSNGDAIASFSSRGPSSTYGQTILKPEVAAPGVSVRSSYPTNTYTYMSGTSMAAPHSTASVALIWNAAPCLQGDVPTTKQIMMETAESKISAQCPPFVDHPNDVWGWGILDELAAVQAAQAYCTTGGLHLNKGKMNWAAAARPGLYKIVYSGRVHDQDHQVVAGVLVTGVYTYPDATQHTVTYTTTALGQFKFPIKESQTGVYQLCVTNMQKTGYAFDPNFGEWPLCMSVTVTP
jgi:subtilisin family serine protease